MAFSIRHLSVLAYANGFTLWHYKGTYSTAAEMSGVNYFQAANDMLSVGDMIMTSASDGAKVLVVASTDTDNVVTASLS